MKNFKTIIIIHSILLAFGIIGCLYGLFTINDSGYATSVIFEFVCILASLMYLFKGYKKDAAKYYRLFMLFMAVTYILEYIPAVVSSDIIITSNTALILLFNAIMYGNTVLLAFGKDLGKKSSYTICGMNIGLYLVCIALGFDFIKENISYPVISLFALYFLTTGIAGLMTVAKYRDKENRKTT